MRLFAAPKRSHHICQEKQLIFMHGGSSEWQDLAAGGTTRQRRLEYKGGRETEIGKRLKRWIFDVTELYGPKKM